MPTDDFGAKDITIQQIVAELGYTAVERDLLEACGREYVLANLDLIQQFFDGTSVTEVVKAVIGIRELGTEPEILFAADPVWEVALDHIEISAPLDEVDQKLVDLGYSHAKVGDFHFMYSVEPRPSHKM
jgi:hypothetical protein